MASNLWKISAVSLLATISAANAGGFSRGTADTDIIFEEGNFNLRAGVTIVSPTRKYTQSLNPALIGTSYTDAYVLPSSALKLNITDDMRCATTMAQTFGGDTSYAAPTPGLGKRAESLSVNEFALTCGYKFDLSKGRAWIIGGLAYNDVSYNLLAGGGLLNIKLSDTATNFRLGVAYEIPEIALRAQALYVSGFDINATGLANGLAPAFGAGEIPQSFEVKVQSGVAPGWLVFGGIKWTDWSVNQRLLLRSVALPTPGGVAANNYFWKDGLTVSAGVGHSFNDTISGAATLSWDRGVKTGWDLSSDTYSLGAGVSMKDELGGELRLGGGLTYIAGAAETNYTPAQGGNSAVSAGWAWALGASYKTKW
jgi:long-chain fatty acid transport protein